MSKKSWHAIFNVGANTYRFALPEAHNVVEAEQHALDNLYLRLGQDHLGKLKPRGRPPSKKSTTALHRESCLQTSQIKELGQSIYRECKHEISSELSLI